MQGREFTITLINMLRMLMGKVDNTNKNLQYYRRRKKRDGNCKKNTKEMLEIKNNVTEMKNVFNGLISRLDMAEVRISELEYIAMETPHTQM